MDNDGKEHRRKRRQHLRVPVFPEEKRGIEANVKRAGVSVALLDRIEATQDDWLGPSALAWPWPWALALRLRRPSQEHPRLALVLAQSPLLIAALWRGGPTFADNSFSGEREADPESEVAAFVNRDHSSHNMTPGYQAEFAPDEAERAGAFIEDALAEQDAAESGDELGASASVGPTDTSTHLMER